MTRSWACTGPGWVIGVCQPPIFLFFLSFYVVSKIHRPHICIYTYIKLSSWRLKETEDVVTQIDVTKRKSRWFNVKLAAARNRCVKCEFLAPVWGWSTPFACDGQGDYWKHRVRREREREGINQVGEENESQALIGPPSRTVGAWTQERWRVGDSHTEP